MSKKISNLSLIITPLILMTLYLSFKDTSTFTELFPGLKADRFVYVALQAWLTCSVGLYVLNHVKESSFGKYVSVFILGMMTTSILVSFAFLLNFMFF